MQVMPMLGANTCNMPGYMYSIQHAQQLLHVQPAHSHHLAAAAARGSGRAGLWPSLAALPIAPPSCASPTLGPAETETAHHDRACKRKASCSGQEEEHGAKLLRQQLQNKAAQQRYRQRRKEREAGLESSLEERRAQSEQAARRAAELEARVKELEAALSARQQVQQQGEEGQPREQQVPADGKGMDSGASDARSSYCASLTSIQAFVREHGLRDRLRAGLPLPGPLLAPLTERVRACADACAAAIDVTRPGALGLLVSSAGGSGCCADSVAGGGRKLSGRAARERLWLQVISDLALSDAQIDGLLALRLDLLRELNTLYARRSAAAERLAIEAAAAGAVAGAAGRVAHGSGGVPLTVQADRMRQGGYLLDVAPGSLAVRGIVEAMEADLQEEGRLLSGFTRRVMTGVLAPLQAAVIAATAFPHATDVLSLANALSELTHAASSLAALLPASGPPAAADESAAAAAPRPPRAALVAAAAAAAAQALASDNAPDADGRPSPAAGAAAPPSAAAAAPPAPPGCGTAASPAATTPRHCPPVAVDTAVAGRLQPQPQVGCCAPRAGPASAPAGYCGAGAASPLGASSPSSGDDSTSPARLHGSDGDLLLRGALHGFTALEGGGTDLGGGATASNCSGAGCAKAAAAAFAAAAGAAKVAAAGTLALEECVPLDDDDLSSLDEDLLWL